jgi:hypothetical protein
MIDDEDNTDDDNEYVQQPPKSKWKSTPDILFTTGSGFTSERNQSVLACIDAHDGENGRLLGMWGLTVLARTGITATRKVQIIWR